MMYLQCLTVKFLLHSHLLGRPFGSSTEKSWHLHMLELMALTVVWLINWCGLLLHLALTNRSDDSMYYANFISAIVVLAIAFYFVFATEFLYKDYCKKNRSIIMETVGQRIKSMRHTNGVESSSTGTIKAAGNDTADI